MNTFGALVVLHVAVALSSAAFSTVLFFRPSKDGMRVNAALIVMTLLSGSYLVVAAPAHLMQTCSLGLFYLVFVSAGMVVAWRKLARKSMPRD